MAQVIRMPVERTVKAARTTAFEAVSAAAKAGRLAGWDVDDWGRDDALARVATRLTSLRFDVAIGGTRLIPQRGGAVVAVNSRRFTLTPWFVALNLSREIGRPVRFVGRPDSAPFGSLARRLGGLLARPDEVAGGLRDGQVLVVGATGGLHPRHVGDIDYRLIGPAVELDVPVFPAAVAMSPTSRSARIEIAPAIKPSRHRRGPLGELELTTKLVGAIGRLLAEFGDSGTGTPLDWLPFDVWGRD